MNWNKVYRQQANDAKSMGNTASGYGKYALANELWAFAEFLRERVTEVDLGYDGSNTPQARELSVQERDVLCRIISLVVRDDNYLDEELLTLGMIKQVLDLRRGEL